MSSLDLRSFVARAATLVDSSPPTTKQETRSWLVEPFLEALSWTVRADSCLTDRAVDDTRLEYVLTADSVPALFVAVESATESLDGLYERSRLPPAGRHDRHRILHAQSHRTRGE